jgi:ATP-binding cassette subfamily F protein 3
LLLSLTEAKIGYPSKTLIEQANLQLFAGDRIGILGKNGQGKTSLIKAIIEQSTLLAGKLEASSKLVIGYFSQQMLESLDDRDTPLEIISRANPSLTHQASLNFLGRFGFARDIATNNIINFSGGEKARLVLASIIIRQPNILFLDEPTNHLDIAMREELATALQEFAGAVVLVSHDQFLLESVIEDFYLIENQRLTKFKGSLNDYQQYLITKETVVTAPQPAKAPVAARPRPTNQLKTQIGRLEKQIDQLTQQITKLNSELATANLNGDFTQLTKLSHDLAPLQASLNGYEEQWLILHEQLES